ncbi:hypothetical protein CB1_000950007 [Camelus ferus]|nr:hypothetical protein CB1_000950007 [Camelus ferus]
MGFLSDQGTEKTEESGEHGAEKEENEDAGDLTGSQEKDLSVFVAVGNVIHGSRSRVDHGNSGTNSSFPVTLATKRGI